MWDCSYTDEFRLCCLVNPSTKCEPKPDEFSSCEDLMSNLVLRVCVWVLGCLATLGNAVVIIWRLACKHDNQVSNSSVSNSTACSSPSCSFVLRSIQLFNYSETVQIIICMQFIFKHNKNSNEIFHFYFHYIHKCW